MLEKGKIYRAEVIDVNNLGDGIAKIDGIATFIKGGVTGDIADVKIIKTAKSYAVAMIDKLIQASDHRCENDCPVFKRCGGCVSRHIEYNFELELKRGYVVGALKRAGLDNITVHKTVGTGVTEGYRNKAQYPVGLDKKTGKVKIGFYAGRTHEIADIDECKLAPSVFTEVVSALREYIHKSGVSVYDEENGQGCILHIYLRHGEISGDVMLCLVINGDKLTDETEFCAYMREKCPVLTGILLNINKKNTNVILSDNYRLLWGKDYITDTLCGRDFRISKSAFYQVNRRAAELLYTKAGELAALEKGDILVDLYSGVGTVGMSIADRKTKLYGVEIVAEAIENARTNAEINGFESAKFLAADAAHFDSFIKDRGDGRLIVVVDPPRKGLDASVVRDIAENSPDRVVYISCNPDTLARDIVEFKKHGYGAGDVYTYDLFPRTGHVESVVLLTRYNEFS
ncbi:MAG: 23S rRNA (uracil(1939)-C(5))-methyltransferase RlmD [Clostridia bacterium]|nr:23S rRNA (uracil(1939)-C(5))-methyltransferase RlmD [Clostridia bacterium]